MLKFKIIYLSWVIIVGFQTSKGDNIEIQEEEDIAYAEYFQHTNRVLICLNDDQELPILMHDTLGDLYPKIRFEYIYNLEKCLVEINEKYQSLLAVIAPKPLQRIEQSEIPIYFYDGTYFDHENHLDIFPNAVVPVQEWRLLKHAFTRFFEEQDWIRIAIISDNSWYSSAFEEELVGHFHEKRLVYHVGRCVQVSQYEACDFDEAVKYIKKSKAFIVVANVGAEHAAALLAAAHAHDVKPRNGFVWLARDWTFGRAVAQKIGVVFSFTLAPKLKHKFHCLYCEMLTGAENLPRLTSILHGVSLVTDAVKETRKKRIDHYYRDIARHMTVHTVETQAYIQKITTRNSTVITVGTFKCGHVVFSPGTPAFNLKIYDVQDCALMRSEVFEAPCNDTLLIIFMFVLMMSVLMIFLLAYFFNLYLLLI